MLYKSKEFSMNLSVNKIICSEAFNFIMVLKWMFQNAKGA